MQVGWAITDLNTLVELGPGERLLEAWGINDSGEIGVNCTDVSSGGYCQGGQAYHWLLVEECASRIAHETNQSLYNSPSPDPQHPADSFLPFEAVDLLNGALHLTYEDARLPGNHGHDLVVPRAYRSKLAVLDQQTTYGPEPSSYGVGWQMHQGRLHVGAKPAAGEPPASCSGMVLEMVGEQDQVFATSKTNPGECVSRDFWVLRLEAGTNDRLAIDPDGVEYRFPESDGNRNNPEDKYLYVSRIGDPMGNTVTVGYTANADNWPYIAAVTQEVRQAGGAPLVRVVNYEYDMASTWPSGQPRPLTKVKHADSTGAIVEHVFNISLAASGGCHALLNSVTEPGGVNGGLVTSYAYDPNTFELTGITLPQGGSVAYAYEDHDFTVPGGLERTRVVKSRQVTYTDGLGAAQTHNFNFTYPAGTASDNKTVRTSDLHRAEYEFYNYADSPAWKVGLPRSQRFYDAPSGTVQLASRQQSWLQYAYASSGASIGLLGSEELTLFGTSSALSRREFSYACTGDQLACPVYDDYGRPNEIREKDFPAAATVARTTALTYESGSALIQKNIVGRVTSVVLKDETNAIVRQREFEYGTSLFGDDAPGEVRVEERFYETLGRGTPGGIATSRFRYDDFGNLVRREDSRNPGSLGPVVTNYEHASGRMSKLYLNDQPATPELTRTINGPTGLVTTQTDRNANPWNYQYDSANRLFQDVPPGPYNSTDFDHGPGERWQTRVSGSTYTRSDFDGLGRSASSKTLVQSHPTLPQPRYSYGKRTYDAEGRVRKRYEPAVADQQATSPHTLFTYDGLGRIVRQEGVGNAQGVTTYTYSGNQVSVQPSLGPARTENYSSFGWLLSVTDPDGGTTSYAYDPTGALKTVTPPGAGSEPLRIRTYLYNQLGFLTKEISPEGGTSERAFDETGNVLNWIDADGTQATNTYDYKNRLTRTDYALVPSGSTHRTFEYDGAIENPQNRLWKVSRPDQESVVEYTRYDEQGRVKEKKETICDQTFVTSYTYNGQGLPEYVDYPHFATGTLYTRARYEYTESNQVKKIERNGAPVVSDIFYNPVFSPEFIQFAGGLKVDRQTGPDQAWRLRDLTTTGVTPGLTLHYEWNTDDTVQSITTNGRLDSAAYDPYRRLQSVTYGTTAPNDRVDYTNDQWGNLLTQTSPNLLWNNLPGFRIQQTADARNRVTGLLYTGTGRLKADTQGNNFAYSETGEVSSMTKTTSPAYSTSFRYNGFGQRIERRPDSLEEFHVHDDADQLLGVWWRPLIAVPPQTPTPHLEVLYANGEPLVTVEHNPTNPALPPSYVLAYVNDHLGSARLISREQQAGAAVGSQAYRSVEYFPYGYVKSSTNHLTLTPAPDVRFGFQGKAREGSTWVYYFGARYYDHGVGRWLTTDPVESADLTSPFSWNKYGFVSGDPLRYVDPHGMEPEEPKEPKNASASDQLLDYWERKRKDLGDWVERHSRTAPKQRSADDQEAFDAVVGEVAPRAEEELAANLGDGAEEAAQRAPEVVVNAALKKALAVLKQLKAYIKPAAKRYQYTKATSKVWKSLRSYRGDIRTSGRGRTKRYFKWDPSHGGEIEVYDSKGRHQGVVHPETGKQIKPAVPGRSIKL